ncbi:MAG: RDD family protein, partial [Microbacterium sp.]
MTSPASDQTAPIPRRAIAYLIDAFIAAALTILLVGGLVVAATLAGAQGMLGTLLVGGPIVLLLLLAWFVVYTLMQAGSGSIGMRAQGLRLISERDGARLGFGRALLRNIVFGLACSIVVGYFTPLFDGSGRFQGWHDKAVGALMCDARASAPAAAASADPAPPTAAPLQGAPRPAAPAAPLPPATFPTAPAAVAPVAPAQPTVPTRPAPP